MSRGQVVSLEECSAFAQTVQAKPPAIVHGTSVVLLSLLTAAVIWAAVTKADLVVKAVGRVRPLDVPTKVFTPSDLRWLGAVKSVNFEEGSQVTKDQILLSLDTQLLDNEIARLQRTTQAAQDELTRLARLDALIVQQYEFNRSKLLAQIEEANKQVATAEQRRESEVRSARSQLAAAIGKYKRSRRLVEIKAVTRGELAENLAQLRHAEEQWRQAQLPIDRARPEILRRNMRVVEREVAVKRQELAASRVVKEGDLDSATKELANLYIKKESAVIRAPIDGVVTAGQIDAGDVLETGKSVVEIAPGGVRFEAAVSSRDVGELRAGMPVKIKFDAYDYQQYGVLPGSISYVSPDSTMVDAPGDQEKMVAFLVRIKLAAEQLGRGEFVGDVKLGLGGTAEVVTKRESLLHIFFKKMRHSVSLG